MSERVTFRFRPPPGTSPRRVALHGEVTDFLNGLPMAREPGASGAFAVTVDVPVGVYAYKFVVDGVYTLDPDNPRTRSSGGHRNSVLAVGGTGEPFLHAPAPPFVVPTDGGGLRIVVAVRRGEETRAPVVRYSERAGESYGRLTLERVTEEDEHDIFEGRIPASTARLDYQIGESDDGAAEAQKLVYVRDSKASRSLPEWWCDAVVYTIYVDRFRPRSLHDGWAMGPQGDGFAGGDLEGICHSQTLDSLVDLGVTVLYLTPVHVGASSHRYDFVDPRVVDPHLGGEAAFARLVRECQLRGLRILIDFSFSHAGRAFPPCADVLENGRASAYADWFLWGDGDGTGAPRLRHYGRRTDAPLVNLEHPEVQALVLETVDLWASRGVSGLRLDMVAEVPLSLARAIRHRFLHANPAAVVVGELVPAHAWRWLAAEALDVATDFGFHGALTQLATGGEGATPAVFSHTVMANKIARGLPSSRDLRFVSTHDHPRLMTLLAMARGGDAEAVAKLAYLVLITMPGVPALLYGEELALRAPRVTQDPENVWEDRMPMPWTVPGELPASAMRLFLREILAMRRGTAPLRRGELTWLHADDAWLVYRRSYGSEVVDIAVSFAATSGEITLTDDTFGPLEVLVSVGDARASGDVVTLGPFAALVARRALVPASRVAPRIAHNVALRDLDVDEGRSTARSRPTRIDFAVTEMCNLRCAHCITFAPERTREGTARTLSPWVLSSLLDDLRYASYFGFVHGGESLAAPIFFDVLRAIRAARGDAAYVAHLLTNGVALSPNVLTRLVEGGISSISVSLDGATPETNDAIRLGGRFETIAKNVRHAARFRAETKVDLRLGLSFVVLASNVHEVTAVVDLAASLGVDWVKLEEGAGVNAFAARSLVGLGAEALRDAVAGATTRARELGIVLVDHTFERAEGLCRAAQSEATRAFVRADEFANRSEIRPCRTPWETACIEPDGDVRIGHFFGPVVGNVTRSPLATLWNAPLAQAERSSARASCVCGKRRLATVARA